MDKCNKQELQKLLNQPDKSTEELGKYLAEKVKKGYTSSDILGEGDVKLRDDFIKKVKGE